MFISRLLILSLCGFLLASCAQEKLVVEETASQTPVETKDSLLALQVNHKRQFKNLSVELLQVTGDSRCPKGVVCDWAGNAQLVFLVSTASSAETVTLNTHGGQQYPVSAQAAGYDISLLKVKPYPAINIKIDPNQYMAQLEIKKSESIKQPVIIDVRSEKEYQAGHYPSAINLGYENIDQTIGSLSLKKDSEIIVYCRSGRRSGIAQKMLQELGYTNVINGINQDAVHKKLGTTTKM